MSENNKIKVFEDKRIRMEWDEDEQDWYVSIVDVIEVLTDSVDAGAYWRKLKERLKKEGNETVTNCHTLKMKAADGKMRLTDVANTEQLFRIIQSIPSPKAKPFKMWLAQLGKERIDEAADPVGMTESAKIAKQGGSVAKAAREQYEKQSGKQVVTSLNAKNLKELKEKKNDEES